MNNEKTIASREKTYEDLVVKLKKYKACAFLRPTGFGKTWTLARLISEGGYNKIAYFYPSKVIKNEATNAYYNNYVSEEEKELEETKEQMKEIPNCDMISYAKLARMKDDKMKELKNAYDLIIFDECHKLGGKKTKDNLKKLLKNNKKAHLVGATATPNRMDRYDVVHDVFKDITVYPYTLHDAFQDGLLMIPFYYYCTDPDMENVKKDLKEAALMAGEDINDLKVKEVLKAKCFEIANVLSMDKTIKDACDEHWHSTYLKFVVFFTDTKDLNKNKARVRKWFKKAYPDRTISEMTILSNDKVLKKNVDKLNEMVYQENHIDLIYSVNMLNEGYHVDDLTGEIMYRCTVSDAVFTQQFGRILSSSCPYNLLVFDVVDNIHRKSNAEYNTGSTKKSKNTPGIRGAIDAMSTDIDNNVTIVHNGVGVYNDTTINNNDSIEISNIVVGSTDGYDPDWYIHMNDIAPGDLNLISIQATYREMIAKAVAEAMSLRCREALECHFRKWCKYNNIPYPITDEELKMFFKIDKGQFIKYFKGVLKKNKLEYPLQDAQKLLDIGANKKDGIPMTIFAKWKNVSVRAILDLLDVA